MNTFIGTKQHKKKKKKNSTENSNIQPSLHIHQTSGISDQQLMISGLLCRLQQWQSH